MIDIYISRGNDIEDSFLSELCIYIHDIKGLNSNLWWNDRTEVYTSTKLCNADTVIVLVKDFKRIGKGVYNEIALAKSLGQRVVVAYLRKTDKQFQFYSYELSGNLTQNDWVNYCNISCDSNITQCHITYMKTLSSISQLKDTSSSITKVGHLGAVNAHIPVKFAPFDSRVLLRRRRRLS